MYLLHACRTMDSQNPTGVFFGDLEWSRITNNVRIIGTRHIPSTPPCDTTHLEVDRRVLLPEKQAHDIP